MRFQVADRSMSGGFGCCSEAWPWSCLLFSYCVCRVQYILKRDAAIPCSLPRFPPDRFLFPSLYFWTSPPSVLWHPISSARARSSCAQEPAAFSWVRYRGVTGYLQGDHDRSLFQEMGEQPFHICFDVVGIILGYKFVKAGLLCSALHCPSQAKCPMLRCVRH